MYKTYMHIAQVLQKSIDTCLYSQSLFIYQNRHNIYNLSESLPILYAHTQLMLADPSSRDYITIYPQLKKDIEYTEQFFSSSLNIQWKDSDMLYHLAYSMQDRYLLMKNTLKYLTFWLSRFFS